MIRSPAGFDNGDRIKRYLDYYQPSYGVMMLSAGQFSPPSSFTPADLFASGEAGVWFDPSDFSTLFQDVAGTIPVTATGQAVALIRDKSRTNTGSPLSSELIVNGSFATDTDWTKGTGWTISGGTANRASSASITTLSQAFSFVAGRSYVISFDVVSITSGGFFVRFIGGTNQSGPTVTTAGSYSQVMVAITGNVTFALSVSSAGTAGVIDNVSVRELLTSDAVQTISTARPVLQNDGTNYYLSFDGVDDIMFTGNIDLSGTDAISVFSGLRKISDTNFGMLVELSRTVSASNGSFFITMPQTAGVGDSRFNPKGTVAAVASCVPGSAPVSLVYTALADISDDLATIRLNGSQVAQSTSDQGTGNFGSWPLFIGGRGSATNFYYNGRLYSLIVLGRAATGTEITDTEAWVNGKTGAY